MVRVVADGVEMVVQLLLGTMAVSGATPSASGSSATHTMSRILSQHVGGKTKSY